MFENNSTGNTDPTKYDYSAIAPGELMRRFGRHMAIVRNSKGISLCWSDQEGLREVRDLNIIVDPLDVSAYPEILDCLDAFILQSLREMGYSESNCVWDARSVPAVFTSP